jgi:hypothetical protein
MSKRNQQQITDENVPQKKVSLRPGNLRTATPMVIDHRCDDEKTNFELGRHLGIIA